MYPGLTTVKAQYIAACLICIFFLSCSPQQKNKEAARKKLIQITENITRDIEAIAKEAESLARHIEQVYHDAGTILPGVDKSKYKMAENGVFYKSIDDGHSALWVSGYVPINNTIKDIAYFTEALDDEFERSLKKFPEAVQVYYNDKHSLNRIFPPFDVLSQYPPKMNIPAYNFYYLADKEHNPEKKAVWVNEPYVDPAGRGWMISAIAPVYVKGELAGVPGLDVTITTITERYISSDFKNIMLVDSKGIVVSADESLIILFGLPSLHDHRYLTTILSDQYRTDDYNLLKSKSKPVRKLANKLITEGCSDAVFSLRDKDYVIISENVKRLNWKALVVINQ